MNFSHPNIKTTKSNRPMKTNIEINNEKNNTYKRSNLDEENNSIETENIKKNIVEKQQQLNEKPLSYNIVNQDKLMKETMNKKKKDENKIEIEQNNININEEDDDEGWITPENLYSKLDEINGVHEISGINKNKKKKEEDKKDEKDDIKMEINTEDNKKDEINQNDKNKDEDDINVFVNTADFTLQNACMKMGIPILGVDGLRIRNIKNYILKCTVCSRFIFEVDRQFCHFCGYPYLMKIGYNIFSNGEIRINDRKPEPRKRGQIFDLPAPSTKKNSTVYVLSEDQIPKKGFNKKDINIDKILENYENFKELPKPDSTIKINSSKQYKWGFPKRNPNIPKKYYNKHKK